MDESNTLTTASGLVLKPQPHPIKKERNRYFLEQWRLFCRTVKTGKISWRKMVNVLWCEWAYFFKITTGARAPYILNMELWNECNAGCLFCRDKKGKIYDINKNGSGDIAKGMMPPEMALEVIRQLKDDILVAVLYTNGEPLLYKDLAKVVRYCSDHKVATIIASNGLLLTPENARELLQAGLDFIKIQLSGFTQDVYSVQIRYGEVERLKDNIRMLARMNQEGRYGTIILVDYILYHYNQHQVEQVKQFCQELGVLLNFRPGNPSHGLEKIEPPPIDPAQLPLKVSCDFLWKVIQINFNGNILPCCEGVVWSGAPVYDTLQPGKTKLLDVWRGAQAQAFREKMKTAGRAATPMCAQCSRVGVSFKW